LKKPRGRELGEAALISRREIERERYGFRFRD
jgi:hypothetical protein